MNQDKIGKFISKIRKEKGMTQADLGSKVGVSSKSVSKWECGRALPDIGILIELSEALDVSITELLKGEKLPKITNDDINDTTSDSVKFYQKTAKKKSLKIIISLILLLFLVSFILLFIFVVNNYNNFSIYSISSVDENYTVSGTLINNNSELSMVIGDIRSKKYDESNKIEVTAYSYSLFYDSLLIVSHTYVDIIDYYSSLSNLSIYVNNNERLSMIYKTNFSEPLKIVIKLYLENGEEEVIEIPLKVEREFSNTKLFYNKIVSRPLGEFGISK